MVERKYDWHTTKYFNRSLRALCLDEYELQVFLTSIDRFCASLEKSIYNPEEQDGKIYFELEVSLFTRILIASVEVEGIDAVLYEIEEI